eukprot:scaffold32944_cov73-Isochrysis_galbana.AAC.1
MMLYTPDEPRANCSALSSAVVCRQNSGSRQEKVARGCWKPLAAKGWAGRKRSEPGRQREAEAWVDSSTSRVTPQLE